MFSHILQPKTKKITVHIQSETSRRRLQNRNEVINALRENYGDRLVVYNGRDHGLTETFEIFRNAHTIVGAHGGAMYNMLFAPEGTKVVEIMPIRNREKSFPHGYGIFWMLVNSIRHHEYWRVHQRSSNTVGDFTMDIPILLKAMRGDDIHDEKKTVMREEDVQGKKKTIKETKTTHHHLLIAIPSVTRQSETLCMELKSILSNEIAANQEDITILVHRRGDIDCDEFQDERVVLKRYDPRNSPNNEAQRKDYAELMNDVLKLKDKVSHVMFLDDDVELCPTLSDTYHEAIAVHDFGFAHLGRGGSGVVVPIERLEALRQYVSSHRDNVDIAMMHWAMRDARVCSVRSRKLQMRHVGKISSISRFGSPQRHRWADTDSCGGLSYNHNFVGMSETLNFNFFSEWCHDGRKCSPVGSEDHCATCRAGFEGEDCGIIVGRSQKRRRLNVAPIVLVSNRPVDKFLDFVSLYVIGSQSETKWLKWNVYQSTKPARQAFEDLIGGREREREWRQTFPSAELTVLDVDTPVSEIWHTKYYW